MEWDFERFLPETIERIRNGETIQEIEALIHLLNCSVNHRQLVWQDGEWVIPPAVRHHRHHRPGCRIEADGAPHSPVHEGST
jgi:hypothetical protein